MKIREEISRPGFVIDLMSIALILSVPIVVVVLGVRGFYHRGHDWHELVVRIFLWAIVYWVVLGVRGWWKRRRSSSESVS